MRYDILDRKHDIRKWVEDGVPKSVIACNLNCKVDTLNKYLDRFGIEYHGNRGAKGFKTFNHPQYIPFDEYIKIGVVQTNKLRIKLLKEGLKKHICERCGNSEWEGQPIPLEVHHINGDKTKNELSNLQLLCPNCHALTSTYRGKNIKK